MSNAVVGLHETVLDNLQPHSSLKKLEICSFMGARSAMWMNNIHLISKLQYIKLENCLKWQTLPPFWRLSFLKSLYLNNILRVQGLDYKFNGNDKVHVFPSLEVLYIEKLEALADWFVATATSYECLFPCLTVLLLKECPYLQELPSCPPNLRKLEIANIGWKGLWAPKIRPRPPPDFMDQQDCNWLQGISNYCSISIRRCPNLISLEGHQEMDSTGKCQLILSELVMNDPSLLLMVPLRSITSIQRLEIKENYAMISFPIEADQWFLQVSSSLRYLNFRCLKSLQSLPSSLESLSSLEILCMEDVPQLQLLPNIPASLERLELIYLESLQCLPTSLSFSLKYLELVGIPLQKLPDLPPSLCELRLFNLEHLDCLPSCLHSISSLLELVIYKVPQLQELPGLPPSLKSLLIEYCHPQLMERYGKYAASYEQRFGHIHRVRI
ncbi:hypothetical protein IEQ34_007924 [Dendrobium chrysotoxum]|uniref:R13L1/DRL21-like LRR repeat region domain-containing protein n=1 Tax=Dendrobium chrysotoxum TaxID=161865 RepID=A0AAV7H4T4_DENCH|nr:hypothetical protein IEQ34_007924 [Dendrobium chrysotoxum]